MAKVLGLTLTKDHKGQPMVFFPTMQREWARAELKKAGRLRVRFYVNNPLKKRTVRLMRKRKHWRKRAQDSTHELVTWPTGKPGREACETKVITSLAKLNQWFDPHRASVVAAVIQRRAMRTFNSQQ